ncbi:MAG TPA: GGDEF domain-containing protein, partial [Acidothermaceae bacterium]|nr:GGDEF domain-containing protein [Acidothermaceae bacterium]
TAQLTANFGQEIDDTYETAQALLLAAGTPRQAELTNTLFTDNVPAVEILLSDLQRAHAQDPANERALVQAMVASWARFRATWTPAALLAAAPDRVGTEAELQAAFGPTEGVTDQLQVIERQDASQAHRRGDQAYYAALVLIGAAAAVGLLLGVAFVVFISKRVLPRALAPEKSQADFAQAMQLAGSVEEAQGLLKRHLERIMPKSTAVVFNRTTAGRLEAVTAIDAASPLLGALESATDRSCTAVRTSREHQSQHGEEQLLNCSVCSDCPGSSICTPLTAGGQVIGSVLVNRIEMLAVDDNRRIRDSITQAAPVLANLRTLATAEMQAATDALTDLPNKRSVQEALPRFVAQASRSLTPLAVLSIDLDHFKSINDTFGHGRGDDVLAAVGAVLRSSLRASDFAGRNGGEEFLILLPATGADAALVFAERLRLALRQINIPTVNRAITASIGIAVLPDHAGDARRLEMAADQALYSAKRDGRDRVALATTVATDATAAADSDPDSDPATVGAAGA